MDTFRLLVYTNGHFISFEIVEIIEAENQYREWTHLEYIQTVISFNNDETIEAEKKNRESRNRKQKLFSID
jgi:hypothetical protein